MEYNPVTGKAFVSDPCAVLAAGKRNISYDSGDKRLESAMVVYVPGLEDILQLMSQSPTNPKFHLQAANLLQIGVADALEAKIEFYGPP